MRLTAEDKAYLDKNFKNGMYVEGFVELESLNADKIDLNLPYLAFYGDWTAAPMLDVTAYEVGESAIDDSVLAEDKLVRTCTAPCRWPGSPPPIRAATKR